MPFTNDLPHVCDGGVDPIKMRRRERGGGRIDTRRDGDRRRWSSEVGGFSGERREEEEDEERGTGRRSEGGPRGGMEVQACYFTLTLPPHEFLLTSCSSLPKAFALPIPNTLSPFSVD